MEVKTPLNNTANEKKYENRRSEFAEKKPGWQLKVEIISVSCMGTHGHGKIVYREISMVVQHMASAQHHSDPSDEMISENIERKH